ncbi:hypothetical protein Prudu_1468S001200 [Prunus dulcis]|uniref:Uncharacterized protein n=1 Tax=Prunus dulcis TaxID=3755 RepID=A0A5H2XXS2_PRUDU|nr:hypothetical protein Prudu_1468S001200 [Prunus dulcis]
MEPVEGSPASCCHDMRRLAVGGSCGGAGAPDGPTAAYHRRSGLECWASHIAGHLVVCPLPRMLRDGSIMVQTWMTCWLGRRSVLSDFPSKGKADVKSSKNKAATSLAEDVSQLRKKPRIPSTKKTQIAGWLVVCAVFRVFYSSLMLTSLKTMICFLEQLVPELILPSVKEMQIFLFEVLGVYISQRMKIKVGSLLMIQLLSHEQSSVRLAEAKKARESSARAKGSSMSAVDLKVNKSSPAGDACVFNLLKTNFLSNSSSYAEMNSSIVAPSSAQLSELEKKKLKSSLAKKDYEVSSSVADLASQKNAFFRVECKKVDISLIYDKLLARFRDHHKSAEKFKFEATIDAYKLGYMHCTNRIASFYVIEDGDIEVLCLNLFLVQSEQVNVVNMEGTEEAEAHVNTTRFRLPGIFNTKRSLNHVPASNTLDIPQGYFAMYVGGSQKKQYVIPISYFI